MGRPRKFSSPKKLMEAWEAYKKTCDNHTITVSEYNKKTGLWEEISIRRPVSYSIEGLCLFIGISRQAFYETYGSNPEFLDSVNRAREEAEVNAKVKFETEQLPAKLAPLWMSRYGWNSSKPEGRNEASGTVVFTGESELED